MREGGNQAKAMDRQGSTGGEKSGQQFNVKVEGYGIGITGGKFDRDGSGKIIKVNEDHRLIAELGFDRWWNIVRNGPVGLVSGINVNGQNLYRFTLTQCRIPCVCLYTEDEFEELIVEAHYKCRYHVYRCNDGKERRRRYWCRYCKEDFSDKNALSYHRHRNLCSGWRALHWDKGGVLKMYPTFSPSDTKSVGLILTKHGLKFPEVEGRRPWAPRDGVVTSRSGGQLQSPLPSTSRSVPSAAREEGQGSKRKKRPEETDQPHVVRGNIVVLRSQPSSTLRLRKRNLVLIVDEDSDEVRASDVSYVEGVRRSKRKKLPGTTSGTTTEEGREEGAKPRREGLRRLQRVGVCKERENTESESGLGGVTRIGLGMDESEGGYSEPRGTIGKCTLNYAQTGYVEDDNSNFHVLPRTLIYGASEEDWRGNGRREGIGTETGTGTAALVT